VSESDKPWELTGAEKVTIELAIETIKSTKVYQYCKEDLDFNIARGVDAIEQFLKGDLWQ
jgi:hypothetical protein